MTPYGIFVEKIKKDQGLMGVEVGVRDGQNALYLLENKNIKTLFLVDPFLPYNDHEKPYTEAMQEDEYNKLVKNMYQNEDRTIILKKTSGVAMEMFPDELFDFVYIDADHHYDFVKKDLEWFKKIKHGGIIGGHDYQGFAGEDVFRAVNEFAQENNLYVWDLGLRGGGGCEWAIIKK